MGLQAGMDVSEVVGAVVMSSKPSSGLARMIADMPGTDMMPGQGLQGVMGGGYEVVSGKASPLLAAIVDATMTGKNLAIAAPAQETPAATTASSAPKQKM